MMRQMPFPIAPTLTLPPPAGEGMVLNPPPLAGEGGVGASLVKGGA